MRRARRTLSAAISVMAIVVGAFSVATPVASAATGPLLEVNSSANTTVAPGGRLAYHLLVRNIGAEATTGPSLLTASFPAGLEVVSATGTGGWNCSGLVAGSQTATCEETEPLGPHRQSIELVINVKATAAAGGVLTASFTVTGGGAPQVATVDPTLISAAPAAFGVDAFDQQVTDAAGAVDTQAAGHPAEVSTEIHFNSADAPNVSYNQDTYPVEPVRDALVELPPGLVGDPTAFARCAAAQLPASISNNPSCPAASQIGVSAVLSSLGLTAYTPLYNMVAPAGVAARFGFSVLGTSVVLDARLRPGGDYGLTVGSRQISEGISVTATTVTFWGVPADPVHDPERFCPGAANGSVFATEPQCTRESERFGLPTPPYVRPPLTAFLRNPTSCTAPGEGLTTTLHTDSWFNPGRVNPDGTPDLSDPNWKSAQTTSHEAPGYPLSPEPSTFPAGYSGPTQWGPTAGIEGCEEVPFEPSIKVQPTTNAADSPSGLSVDLSIPQNALTEPEAIAQADLRGAVVKLPEGMTINPAQAGGLGGCTEAEIDLHGENTEPTCPNSSKIGTMTLKTPLLDHQIEGSVYLAAQANNPFNSLLALYIVGDDKANSGTVIKLAGEVRANPQSGQLETVFTNQPQLPFEALHLELFGGSHAALITPAHCGTFTTETSLAPWSGNAPATPTDSFKVTSGPGNSACPATPAAFNPKLSAGTQNPTAGAFSPFSLRLTREDATQRLAGLNITLPQGLIGKPAGIPYCPEAALGAISTNEGTGAAQLANPSCPAASQVGVVTVGAGSGPDPFFVSTGKAYLAGPYKGAPLSLVVVAPALAGPFDLGNVVVRNALQVNPETAQVTAVSDPLPQIVHGIPLDLRDVRVNLNRPNFTLNPTSCDPKSIDGTIAGSEGASANVSARFQVGDCGRLAFKPRLAIRLTGPTHRTARPQLRAELTARQGDANIARAAVTLPKTELLEQSHIKTICTRVQYAAKACPAQSVYGYARAWTPLLDQPLEGPVYLRSSSHKLPDLVASLDGQIHIDLDGRIDSVHARIRNTFDLVPDTPVSKFVLTMQGGKKGLLVNNTELCRTTPRASALFDGQNGKVHDIDPIVKTDCGKKAKKGHGRRGAHR